jgi:hypothetical protein
MGLARGVFRYARHFFALWIILAYTVLKYYSGRGGLVGNEKVTRSHKKDAKIMETAAKLQDV